MLSDNILNKPILSVQTQFQRVFSSFCNEANYLPLSKKKRAISAFTAELTALFQNVKKHKKKNLYFFHLITQRTLNANLEFKIIHFNQEMQTKPTEFAYNRAFNYM